MKILVCNAGSTSLKFKLFDMPGDRLLSTGNIERVGSDKKAIFRYFNCNDGGCIRLTEQAVPTYSEGIRLYLAYLLSDAYGVLTDVAEIERVGFKTVLAKGYYGVHELTPEVLAAMEEYLVVAPVHNKAYLETIRQFQGILPGVRMIGVFETSFHTTIPQERKLYGIPYEWYERYGIQRFGYHSASHSYVADVVTERTGGTGRLISCHLGGSGSLCAIDHGKSVDNSFGFSLQTGLIHANRIGDADPYLIPFLLAQGMRMEEILNGMDQGGGLLGISGVSNDLRDIEAAAAEGNKRARLAIDTYCNGVVKYIGAYYAELGGLDHLVFTGGIGENSAPVRRAVCEKLGHLGIQLSEQGVCDASIQIISSEASTVTVWIIPANEELGIARKTYQY